LTLLKQIEFDRRLPELEPARLFGVHKPSETSERVSKYFQTSGFSRWAAIYGEGGIPPIWRVIREGHDRAMKQVMDWVADDGSRTALDAGCGTGALSMRLAECGYDVHGFDVSAPMVSFARYATADRTQGLPPKFFVGDIAAVEAKAGAYDLVCCLDVLFHYPYEEVRGMLDKLASLSSYKIIGSFALRTPLNSFWMQIGKRFFHQKNRMTNLFLLSYDDIEQVLYRAGFRMTRTHRIKKLFYDSFIFEAVRR
jgi:magnesium-protoporphyrin O-methyltransferase